MANIYSNERVVDRKQGLMLLNSNYTKNFPELVSKLKRDTKNPIIFNDELTLEEKNFFKDVYPNVYHTACDEWYLKEYREIRKGENPCDLCTEKNNTAVFVLKNKINGKTFNVGSTCKDTFGELKTKDGTNIQIFLLQEQRGLRKNTLNNHINGIVGEIEEIIKNKQNLYILLPNKMYEPYEIEVNNLMKTYNNFLDRKKENLTLITSIKDSLNKVNDLKKDIDIYIENQKSNPYIITEDIGKWAINFPLIQQELKNEGHITKNIIHMITEDNFMNLIAKKFEESDEIYSIAKSINGTYELAFKRHKSIKLACSHKTLIKNNIDYLFGNSSNIDINEIIKNVNVIGNASIENAMLKLNQIYKRGKFKILDWENGKLYCKNGSSNVYVLNLSEFVNANVALLYNEKFEKHSNSNLDKYIQNNFENSMSYNDYKKLVASRNQIEQMLKEKPKY